MAPESDDHGQLERLPAAIMKAAPITTFASLLAHALDASAELRAAGVRSPVVPDVSKMRIEIRDWGRRSVGTWNTLSRPSRQRSNAEPNGQAGPVSSICSRATGTTDTHGSATPA